MNTPVPTPALTGNQPPAGNPPPQPSANPPVPQSQAGGHGGQRNQRPQPQQPAPQGLTDAHSVRAAIPATRTTPPAQQTPATPRNSNTASNWKQALVLVILLIVALIGLRFLFGDWSSYVDQKQVVSEEFVPKALPVDDDVITHSSSTLQQQRKIVFPDSPKDFTVVRINKTTGQRETVSGHVSPTEVERYKAPGKDWKWSKEANYFDPQGNKMPGPR